jgi:hypothetical protein
LRIWRVLVIFQSYGTAGNSPAIYRGDFIGANLFSSPSRGGRNCLRDFSPAGGLIPSDKLASNKTLDRLIWLYVFFYKSLNTMNLLSKHIRKWLNKPEAGPAVMWCIFFGPLILALLGGCASSRPRFQPAQPTSNKSLVYVFWGRQFLKGVPVAIHVNEVPCAVLHVGGYYPLELEPGPTSFGFSFQAHPIFPIRVRRERALDISLEAGKTYYVAYRPWSGKWHAQLVQLDPAVGSCEVTNYTLGREWKK